MINNKTRNLASTLALFFVLACSVYASAANTPISINVVNEDVKVVLYTLASISNTNIVVDDNVTGTITMSLNNVSFNAALDAIAKVKGYSYQINNGMVFFGTSKIVPGELFVFKLQNARAEDVFTSVAMTVGLKPDEVKQEGGTKITTSTSSTSNTTGGTSDSGGTTAGGAVDTGTTKVTKDSTGVEKYSASNDTCSLSADLINNAIVFRGGRSDADRIRDMLNVLDVPQKQVSIQAEIVSMSRTDADGLGVEWSWSPFAGSLNVGSGQASTGSFSFTTKLDALVAAGKAKLMARPNIMTVNNKPGIINVGKEIPMLSSVMQNNNGPTGNNSNYYTLDRVQTGIILQFTPKINQDNSINADISVEVSEPEQVVLFTGVNDYSIYKRSATTNLLLKNGETIVIGGLIKNQTVTSDSKVWGLGDIPIIGWLFKGHSTEVDNDELVIFVTAKVVE